MVIVAQFVTHSGGWLPRLRWTLSRINWRTWAADQLSEEEYAC